MTKTDQAPFDCATSMHCSYWRLEALEDFTSFCIEGYRDARIRARLESKYQWHRANGRPGGICEMTLLHLWRERHQKQVWNLAETWNGMTADLAIGTSENACDDEYEMRLGLKRLSFEHGLPYGRHTVLREKVRFLALHCQGAAKRLMPLLTDHRWRRFYAESYVAQAARSALRARVGVALRSARSRTAGLAGVRRA